MPTDFILQVITSATVSGILSSFLLWLTKSWISERLKNAIKNEYDQKLETHKAQLKAQSDVEIEKLRSQLSIFATEHEVRFSRLHEKRALVIAKTYSLLKKVYIQLENYLALYNVTFLSSEEQRRNKLTEALTKFRKYYAVEIIFLPKIIADKLMDIDFRFIKVYLDFVNENKKQEMEKNGSAEWSQFNERIGSEIKPALEQLENEFRRLLGDET